MSMPNKFIRKRKTNENEEVVANVVSSSAQLVHGRNIDYVNSQLDFATDLGETAQRLARTRIWKSTFDAERKGKIVRRENNIMSFADRCAQRGNKGISICENSLNSRSEEMTKPFGASNNHSSGQNLQFQNMNQVNPNYFLGNSMMGVSMRPSDKPITIAHPSKIIGPSRFSPNYDQNMQRTLASVPQNFSLMKLLMGNESSTTLNEEEFLYANEVLSTDQGLSSEGQRVQQWPFSQVGNYQNMQRIPESATWNFPYLKLLMEGKESSKLTNDLYEKQLLNTQYNLSSEGQMMQQSPFSQVGNNQFENLSQGQRVKQSPFSQVGNTQFENLSKGQRVKQSPFSQVGNYQFENSSEGQKEQQLPCSQVGNNQFKSSSEGQMLQQSPSSQIGSSPFDNSLQQDRQNQVLPQPQEISFRELLARDNISYMDLLTREDLLISRT